MNTSLIISETMNLDELADRMGGATAAEAHQMRFVLICSGYDGKTTDDVPYAAWVTMLDEAVELSKLSKERRYFLLGARARFAAS